MNENEMIKRRILNLLDVASLQMSEFISLLDVRLTSKETKTACVSCSTHPILYLNKDFIDNYCQSDEHLFMLVMHELYHIILGHTSSLFNASNKIDNIVYDAVINSILCKAFNEEKYVSFFKNLNKEDTFPSLLLRPKGSNTPKEYEDILNILYNSNNITYYELYKKVLEKVDISQEDGSYLLLGNHENNSNMNPMLKDMLNKITSSWPKTLIAKGRDDGNKLTSYLTKEEVRKIDKTNHLKYLLKKMGMFNKENKRCDIEKSSISSFTPNYLDRCHIAKDRIYQNKIIYLNNNDIHKPVLKENKDRLIYIDVSGSVINHIEDMFPLLAYVYKRYRCKIYAFSTEVDKLTYKDLKNKTYRSTCGTEINCVFDHIFNTKNLTGVKDILILTDGGVGSISSDNLALVNKHKLNVYVGLFGHSSIEEMKQYVKEYKEI